MSGEDDSNDADLSFSAADAPGNSASSLVLSPSHQFTSRRDSSSDDDQVDETIDTTVDKTADNNNENASTSARVASADDESIINNSKRARALSDRRSLNELLEREFRPATTTDSSSSTSNNNSSSNGTSNNSNSSSSGVKVAVQSTTTTTTTTTTNNKTTTENNNNENSDDDDTPPSDAGVQRLKRNDQRPGVQEAAGGRTVTDYSHEDPSHPNWKRHHKHVFVVSSAGKPIYARYGDEQRMAPFMAAISAVVSFVDDSGDTIRHFKAGRHQFVFLLKGPLYLVAIADTGESPQQLSLQLNYVHAQIISILTSGVTKIFRNKAAFDLRNLLGGADVFIDALLHRMEHDASFFVDAVHCARLPPPARAVVGQAMAAAAHPQLLFAIMCANMRLVHLVRPKRFVLHPLDLHLVMNFVSSSTSFRSNECWTPICLPQFNDRGFLHAHVCYISQDVCLVLVSAAADAFFDLAQCKSKIVTSLNAHGALQAIQTAAETPSFAVSDTGVPGLLHFVYKSCATNQFTSASVGAPYIDRHERKRLFRLYQHVFAAMRDRNPPHKVYYHTTEKETIVGWVTGTFELYAVFGPLEAKSATIKACNGLLRWIKRNEESLFILSSPVW